MGIADAYRNLIARAKQQQYDNDIAGLEMGRYERAAGVAPELSREEQERMERIAARLVFPSD